MMSFYMQHGYGKSQKIQSVAATGDLEGVVLSVADEDEAALSVTAATCLQLGLQVRVDPQSYVYTTAPKGMGKHHAKHGVDFPGLHWSQDANTTARQVKAVGALNERINARGAWIAPSVLQSSFTDVWTPVALQLARTASEAWGADRTIASLIIDESALETWSAINVWLDVATTLDVRGFYILVARSNTTYPPVAWSSERLSNLLRLIYTLSVLNNYEVSWGYSDSEGILGLAAGASSISSGWSYTLRQFNLSKWQPNDSTGGRAPIVRFNTSRLWSPLRAESEADRVFNSDLRGDVFTRRQIQDISQRPLPEWSRAEAQDQHIKVIASRSAFLSQKSITERLDWVGSSLSQALTLFDEISQDGIILEQRYRPRVEALSSAMERFRKAEGL
jgi:hypothetical protein